MATGYSRIAVRKLVSNPSPLQFSHSYKTTAAVGVTSAQPFKKTADEDIEWNNAKPFDEIPGPKALPLLGTAWTYFPVVGHGMEPKQQIDIIRHHAKKYGKIWKEHLPGGMTLVSTVNTGDTEKMFRLEGKLPGRPGLDAMIKYREDRKDLFESTGIIGNGQDWWKNRKVAQQVVLKAKSFNKYIPLVDQVSSEFVERIRLIRPENNEMNDDFLQELYRWSLESVWLLALDSRLGCFDANLSEDSEAMKVIVATALVFNHLGELTVSLPLWKYYETPVLRQLHEALDFLVGTTMKYIRGAVESLEKRDEVPDEFMSILEDILSRGLSLKETMTVIMDLMLGGIDTTAHSVAYMWYLLARNPEQQEKLREEVLRVVGPANSPVTEKALNRMPFLKGCFKETLRVMPVSISNARITEREMVLSGYRIPIGTTLASCQIITGVSEEAYGKNAQEFVPERWIKGHPLETPKDAYAVLPFGFGKRMCLGRKVAELEAWHVTIKMLQNFRIEYHHEDIDCVSVLISKPNKPLRFKFVDL